MKGGTGRHYTGPDAVASSHETCLYAHRPAGSAAVTSPSLIRFTAERPGVRLVGDITSLKTGEGWLYMATVIDLATLMVVGWQTAEHLRTSLVVTPPPRP